MALTDKLVAIGDAIRDKTGDTSKYTLDEMVTAISGIATGSGGTGDGDLPEEALTLTGSRNYTFAYNNWNWFIDKYKGKITTKDITSIGSMFRGSTGITEIPFDINIQEGTKATSSNYIFASTNITRVPYINGQLDSLERTFEDCRCLNYIPEDWGDHIDWSRIHSGSGKLNMFYGLYSIRHIPDSILRNKYNGTNSVTSCPYYGDFVNCYALDELKGIAVQPTPVTSNMFTNGSKYLSRIKSYTFATVDGVAKTANWKTQTLDLSSYIGYCNDVRDITDYSEYHGITEDKLVASVNANDENYMKLKNDPDWFTTMPKYSRYNHDSAVETINTLPDTSAYLAEKGGTNTIKFLGNSGEYTDGGAINTLTEEEIAVATAKGWTVSFA